jgi:mannosyltransferase
LSQAERRESRSRRQRGREQQAARNGGHDAHHDGWAVRWLLVLVLLVGFGLHLYELDGKGLWYDELGTALYTSPEKSPWEVVKGPLEVPIIPAPPLYFLSTYGFRLLSDSDFVLRLPSVFYGALAIAAIYTLGRELLGPRRGLLAAFLLSISAFHVRYSQEARYYALLMLLGTLSLFFFYRGLRRNDARSWAGYVVTSTLAVYTHLFAFLFLAVQGVYALSFFLYGRLRARPAAARPETARPWKREPFFSFLASAAVMALLYLPMLPFTLRGLLGQKGLAGRVSTVVSRTSLSYLAGILDLFGAGPGLALLCYLAALGLGLYFLVRQARRELALVALWMVLPFAVVLLVPAGHSFRLRYVIFVLPVFLIVVSAGLVGLGDLVSRWAARRWSGERARAMATPVSLVILCSILGLLSIGALGKLWDEGKQPWDKASSFLQTVVGPSEAVVATGEDYADRLLYYGYDASEVTYLASCPCPARVVLEDWHRFPELAAGYNTVWLLDPNPNYRHLRPGGSLAEELEGYIFLPPVVFKGYSSSNVVERDLLAPFTTSDINLLVALPKNYQPSDEEIVRLSTEVAQQADALFPGGTRLHFTLGELFRFYGSEEEAVEQYEAAIADDPDYYSAYEGLALIHILRGQPQQALELYQDLVARGVIHESYYHFLLGSLRLVDGDVQGAATEFALAVRLDGDNVDYRLKLGDAYRALGGYVEAMAQYEEITHLDPSHVGAYSRRASIYRATGRLAEAAGEYQTAIELWPENPLYHALLADTYRYQGLLDEALVEAQAAVRLEDGEAAYHVLSGEILQALERLPEAIAEFEIGVQLAPEVAPYYLDLADAYRLAGRNEEAVKAYERVLELDPDNAGAAEALEELP